MKNNLSILATLALAATLLPAAFAQQGQSTQPKGDQIAITAWFGSIARPDHASS